MAKKVTMMDIAKKCGVSQTLVSFVLSNKSHGINEKTKETVLDTAKAMGYELPSRTYGKSIGILCDSQYNAVMLSQVLMGIYGELSKKGYTMTFEGAIEDFDARIHKEVSGQAVGYILISANRSALSEFSKMQLPFSFLMSSSRDAKTCGSEAATAVIDIIEGRASMYSEKDIEEAELHGVRGVRRESVWLL